MKAEPKHVLAGAAVIVILILLASWKFLYSPSIEKADAIEAENKQLEARKLELNNKIANKAMYQEGIDSSKKIIDAVFEKYGAANKPEKTIMMLVDVCNMTGVEVNSISFSDDIEMYQSPALKEDGTTPQYVMKKSNSTVNLTGGYLQLKKVFDFINYYKERMNVQTFSSEFDLEMGVVNTTLMLNLYAVEDDNHVYVAPDPGEIELGTPNIFRGKTYEDLLAQQEAENGENGMTGDTGVVTTPTGETAE